MSRTRISNKLREQIIARANGCCEFCRAQLRYSPNSFHVEHHIPICLGGSSNDENLTLACPQCNLHKAAKTAAIDPVTEEVVLIFNPRQMRWDDHFIWSDETTYMIGTTAIGRATVALLQTNRENLVSLRWALQQLRLHPPDGL